MKSLFCLTLGLLSCQSLTHQARWHWCDQPTRKLRWLNRMIDEIQVVPPFHHGWEVHQARYWGQEVFVLHWFLHSGKSRGFLLYNHWGDLIQTGTRADSIQLADLITDRMLAASPGRFKGQR